MSDCQICLTELREAVDEDGEEFLYCPVCSLTSENTTLKAEIERLRGALNLAAHHLVATPLWEATRVEDVMAWLLTEAARATV